jgi:hypothetical protein
VADGVQLAHAVGRQELTARRPVVAVADGEVPRSRALGVAGVQRGQLGDQPRIAPVRAAGPECCAVLAQVLERHLAGFRRGRQPVVPPDHDRLPVERPARRRERFGDSGARLPAQDHPAVLEPAEQVLRLLGHVRGAGAVSVHPEHVHPAPDERKIVHEQRGADGATLHLVGRALVDRAEGGPDSVELGRLRHGPGGPGSSGGSLRGTGEECTSEVVVWP